MNLEAAISQLIELGEKDPIVIARKLDERQGREWLVAQLMDGYAEQFVADIARQRLGAMRRSSVVALHPGDTIDRGELKLRAFWIPKVGYVRAADVTSEQLIARAEWNDHLTASIVAHSQWCRDVARLMADEGVKTLGRLKAALPTLGAPGLEAA